MTERRERRVVDLQIPASEQFQTAHLLGININEISKLELDVGVDVGVFHLTQTVQHVGRRNRQLRHGRRVGFEKDEVLAENRALQMKTVRDFGITISFSTSPVSLRNGLR